MCDTMEHFFDSVTPLQSDAYRIGRRTRSAARDEEVLDELEAIEAHLFADHRRAFALADVLGDRPPVSIDSLLEGTVADGEYQLFVTEIHEGLLDAAPMLDSRAAVEELAADFAEAVASSSEPSSPAITPTGVAEPVPSAAAMFRAASAAAASPTSVIGPRRRRTAQSSTSMPSPSPSQRPRSSKATAEEYALASFDSVSVTSDGDDEFDGTFEEINIEITDCTAHERYTTVITSVTPMPPPANTPKRRNNTPSGNNKRSSANSPATPGKRGRRTTTTTTNTTFTVIETTTNYLEDKPSRTGSFAGEEVLRISSVVIEETDVDILN